jgi:hypothetical protein
MPAQPALEDLPLYTSLRRRDILAGLDQPPVHAWYGHLAANGQALVLASLATDGWQVLGPDVLRREIRRHRTARRRPGTRLVLPTRALLFCQPKARAAYLYVGQVSNYGFAHGATPVGHWTDFVIQPPLPADLWENLRFHTLRIDGRPVAIRDYAFHGWPDIDIHAVLEPVLFRRRRVTVVIDDRVRGRLTYSKQGSQRSLVHERAGTIRQASALYEQSAYDALWVYWHFGELFSHLEWTPPTSGWPPTSS